jgi:3-oxoadipate enol-lactonase
MTLPAYVVDGPTAPLTHAAQAPVLLLAGSLGSTVDMWLPQVPRLSRTLRVVRFDHRGHGRSPVPPGPYTVDDLGGDVLRLMDHLGVARAHVAGLSLGGMVGMWLAAHAPERVDRLALLCTAAHLPPAQGWLDRAAAVRTGGMAAVAEAVVDRWFTGAFTAREPYLAMVGACPVEGYAGCCEAIAAMDLRPVLGRIRARTLVIAGEQDPATPPAMAEQIVAAVPGARLVVVPGAAHLSNVEQSETVTRLLVEHLEA